jgi:hypothetical protein
MKTKIQMLSCALTIGAVSACGGSTSGPSVPDESTSETTEATVEAEPTTEPTTPAAPEAWSDDLTDEQKLAFMVDRVVPAMKPVFAQADDFGCATCHGDEQTNSQQFEHPNKALPGLTLENGKMTSFETNPDVSKFMAEKVLPAMAEVMGRETYSEQNPAGMGCNGCHAVEMK